MRKRPYHYIPVDVKIAVVNDYYSGSKTLNQICAEYGLSGPRRIYEYVEKYGHGIREHRPPVSRQGIYLSLDETELLLLMISEFEKISDKRYRGMLRNLEDRLLDISDKLYELKLANR